MVLLDAASLRFHCPPLGGVLSQHEVARLAPHLVVELVASFRAEPFRPVLARLRVQDGLARSCLLLPFRPGLLAVFIVELVGRLGPQRLRSWGALDVLRLDSRVARGRRLARCSRGT